MAQDTRKDPRAKVLTMTVRYKSATVDEFIEHHSHDVSRGGIYIKTPSPFQPGTLLKFEIRIADDKPMLQGVGRVVWKRESAGPGSEKPAGMGVKFIKVDEASRNLIDRLVASKGDDISSYDAEPVDASAGGSLRSTHAGARAGGADARAGGERGGSMRRAGTMMGLGVEPPAEPAAPARGVQRPSQAPRSAEAMFPKTDSESDMPPPEERTVMKQAAQLLEEALKGAGGSIEELGGAQGETVAKPVAKPVVVEPARGSGSGLASPAARPSPSPSPVASRRGAEAEATRAGKPVESTRGGKARPAVELARPAAAAAVTDKKPASANTIAVSLLLVAAASVVGYVAWQNHAPEPAPDEPSAPAAAPVPTAATPTPTPVAAPAEPLPTAAPAVAASASPPPPAAASAALPTVAPAPSAATAVAPAASSAAAVAQPARAPASAPSAAAPRATPAAVTAPPAAPVPQKTAPVDTAPVAAPIAKPSPTVAKPAPVAPKPKAPATPAPKPAPKADDDNPY